MKPGIDLLTLWRGKGLARQIISSVAILALTIMLMVLLGSYAFYSTLFIFLPTALSAPDSWLPSPAEWGWIVVTTLIGVAIAVFRIFQEILSNIARHAQATHVHIRITVDDPPEPVLYLDVRDDGIGAPPQALADARSYGVLGMRERAAHFGGRLVIDSAPGQGTRVRLVMPLGTEVSP